MTVQWPDMRENVIAGLEVLAAPVPALSADGVDQRWPDLTNAVHWVVDDTWWDQHDATESIGTLLEDSDEAAAISAVVAAVVGVADRRATASDNEWFSDSEWPTVQELAAFALNLMRRH